MRVIQDPDEPQLKTELYKRPGGPTEGLMVFARRADGTWKPCGWIRAKDKQAAQEIGPVDRLLEPGETSNKPPYKRRGRPLLRAPRQVVSSVVGGQSRIGLLSNMRVHNR
ncbi:hypothetical protein Bbelb_084620 [Branchiostoma belcheri]|nr:hypothetical protein Bbelb_084620 [Branchiostoma belcheri]